MVVGNFVTEIDLVVIGAGPGGYVAAIRASQLGRKVTLIEKGDIGGVCLNVGCIPSKALINAGHRFHDARHSDIFGISAADVTLDFARIQKWKDEKVVKPLTRGIEMLLKKHKVDVVSGEAFFIDSHHLQAIRSDSAQTFKFKDVIIASGSRPIAIGGFKFGKRIVDSTGGLNLKELPKKLAVIGGGYVGTELAGAYANLGSEVTILEGTGAILGGFEPDAVKLVLEKLAQKRVTVITNAQAKSAKETENGVTLLYRLGDAEHSIDVDYIMMTVGRRPNTDELGLEYAGVKTDAKGLIEVNAQCRTNVSNIYAIGDVVRGPALAHKASYEGKVAAEVSAGCNSAVEYTAIPTVCFSDPEIATVGLTLKEAKAQGFNATASTFPLAGNGRALSMAAGEGFVRLVTEADTHALLGACIVGAAASENIAELTLAIECGLSAEDIALTIHNHPSVCEANMDAAELALGQAIHL
jgi:dihydrolipoamide dehydrogenase